MAATFKTAAEARAWVEDNASLPSETLREALDHIVRVAWCTGVEARALTEKECVEEIAAFLARPEHVLSASHGEALMLLSRALVVLGGGV